MNAFQRKTFATSLDALKRFSLDPYFKFAYQSKYNWMVTCLIAQQEFDGISFEEICSNFTGSFCSRSTIQSILENGISKNFFVKMPRETDKRVQLYSLSEQAEVALGKWIEIQIDIFN